MKEQSAKPATDHKRPGKITMLCILGFAIVVLIVPAIINNPLQEMNWFAFYLVAVMAVSAVSIAGIWMMKRWGYIVYAILFGVNQAILALLMGGWLYLVMVLPVVVLIFSYRHFPDFE